MVATSLNQKLERSAQQTFLSSLRSGGYLIEPEVIEIGKARLVCDVIHCEDPMRTLVVGRCDGTEALLTSGIPNLQLDDVAVDGQ